MKVSVTCGNAYCRNTFYAKASPSICPYCNGVNHFQVYQPPYQPSYDDYLSSYEKAQLNAQLSALAYQQRQAMQSSRDSFATWIKNSFGWLWDRIKELGKAKAGLSIIASLIGWDVDW